MKEIIIQQAQAEADKKKAEANNSYTDADFKKWRFERAKKDQKHKDEKL
jgi:hypothetical protein